MSLNNPMATVNLINPSENVTDVLKKCSLDFMLFGGFALNIVKNREGGIAEIYHIDFSRLRSGKIDTDTDKVKCYYYCPDWKNTRKYTPEEYPAFDMNDKSESQVFYFKTYIPSMSYYPIPDWSAGQRSIETDIESKNFHMCNLRNGMLPSLFFQFNNGIPPEEDQRIMTRALEEQYGGSDNAGRAVISFNENPETAPTIIQIQRNDNDTYYKDLNEDIVRSILSSHRVSSAELFGIATAGKLGGSDEITQHSEYFRKMVIMPYQNEILPVFNKLVSLNLGRPTTFDIKPTSPYS